jgi:hypothetical protein
MTATQNTDGHALMQAQREHRKARKAAKAIAARPPHGVRIFTKPKPKPVPKEIP